MMASGRRLSDISVSYSPGQVGVSLTYAQGPKEHILLPITVAEQVRDRFKEACALARQSSPGDSVRVSEYSGVAIRSPKEEH